MMMIFLSIVLLVLYFIFVVWTASILVDLEVSDFVLVLFSIIPIFNAIYPFAVLGREGLKDLFKTIKNDILTVIIKTIKNDILTVIKSLKK